MPTPILEINLGKIIHNAKFLNDLNRAKGIETVVVTKAMCGSITVAKALVKNGLKILGDSRITNIMKMRNAKIEAQYILLRSPFLSQARDVVLYADISLNSEIVVVQELSKMAQSLSITHDIILMVELGDLREGIMPPDMENTIKTVLELKGVKIVGIGTNLACFGGVKPDENNMGHLSTMAEDIEKKFDLKLQIVSGGNSSNHVWLTSTNDIKRINQLRLGESIYLGCETLNREPIPDLYTNAFTLIAEVIESKAKPSLPYGEICQDVSGNIPKFLNQGTMTRAILGIGSQDVEVSGLTPLLDVDILGWSSDHLIINDKNMDLYVGKEVCFSLNYNALLSAMNSPTITKNYC